MNERLNSLQRALAQHAENIVLLDVTSSTHAMARRLISEMDEESQELGPTLILADRQEHGEGRGEHRWQQSEQGLYLNWLRTGIGQETLGMLPMLAAAATRQSIAAVGVADTRIKWPNDILVKGEKIAGLLVFARHGEKIWFTVGLGVNLASAPAITESDSPPATAIADHVDGGDFDRWRHDIACSFIETLVLSLGNPGSGLEDWRRHLVQRAGDDISVRLASGEVLAGSITEITKEGFLRIQGSDGERLVTGGDVVES